MFLVEDTSIRYFKKSKVEAYWLKKLEEKRKKGKFKNITPQIGHLTLVNV